ncbi:MAG: hypothetical protein QM765_18635 [Myxococcales bacterium]
MARRTATASAAPRPESCVSGACVADKTCAGTETPCGNNCCNSTTEVCAAGTCQPMGCPSGTTTCGSQCCSSGQTCDSTTNQCKTASTCNATQIECGSACCAKASQYCDPATTSCKDNPTCNASESACGTACCNTTTQFCKDVGTSTCGTLASCNASTETVCGESCCLTDTKVCDTATKTCKDKPSCGTGETACGANCCTSAQTCDTATGTCKSTSTCTVDSSFATLTLTGEGETGADGAQIFAELPAADGSSDVLSVEFYPGMGAFANGIGVGTYQLTGDDLNYKTCGLCIRIMANIDSTGQSYDADYFQTGGAVEITQYDATTITLKLTNVGLQHVEIAEDYTSTPVNDGCTTTIAVGNFTAAVTTVTTGCDPVAQDCTASGQACYINWETEETECSAVGQGAQGATCTTDTDCAKGLGCNAGDNYDKCSPYCDLANPTCPAAFPACDDMGTGVGGCWEG